MRRFRPLRTIATPFILVVGLSAAAGCGDRRPTTGTAASPVDQAQAADQNNAMQNFYQAKMKPARR